MATYDAASLLDRFNRFAGRPTSNDSMTDASKYSRLTDAQNQVVAAMMARVPKSLYPHNSNATFPTCTASADQNVFTFGTDSNGYAIAPMGKTLILPTVNSFPNYAWIEGSDYTNEGTQIRLTNGRTWAAPLYWYGVTPPADIDATHQAALFPEASRMLIVFDAVRTLSMEGSRDMNLFALMQAEYQKQFAEFCLVWKTQFSSGGALGGITGLRLAEAGGGVGVGGY